MAELEEDVRSVAMAELEAVHLDLTNLCRAYFLPNNWSFDSLRLLT